MAESSKEDIQEALSHLVPSQPRPEASITMDDLFALKLSGDSESSVLRDKLCLKLHLGHANAKTLLKRANSLGLTKKDLEEAIHD